MGLAACPVGCAKPHWVPRGGSKTQGSASSSHVEGLGHVKTIIRLVPSDVSAGGDPGATMQPLSPHQQLTLSVIPVKSPSHPIRGHS